jgi:hypothetical protein
MSAKHQSLLGAGTCALLAGLALAGCGNEERPRAEPSPEPPAAAAPANAPPAAPAVAPIMPQPDLEPTADELPVSEDFDSEAEQQITEKNFREELAKLEKEIPAEGAPANAPAPAPAPAAASQKNAPK